MDKKRETSWELRLYELLGVKVFRFLVFKLEKLIHIRDKGKNINYHLGNYEPSSLDAFIKYLFYNGAIHVRNIIYFACYLLLHFIFEWPYGWYDVLFSVLALKDVYCIMLQRYNYVRICQRKQRLLLKKQARLNRRIAQYRSSFQEHYNRSFAQCDLAVISEMKRRIANGDSIVITDRERDALERLSAAFPQRTNAETKSEEKDLL